MNHPLPAAGAEQHIRRNKLGLLKVLNEPQQQIIMESGKSFFPTRAEVKTSHKPRPKLYFLRREVKQGNNSYSTLEPEANSNIFAEDQSYNSEQLVQRPIGGESLFKKMEQITQERRSNSKKLRRSSKDYKQRNAMTAMSNTSHNMERMNTDVDIGLVRKVKDMGKDRSKTQLGEELYKSHQIYRIPQRQQKLKEEKDRKRTMAKSFQTLQPHSSSLQTIQKMERQCRQHIDKKALLGQIERSRPLIELTGDSYFQMILRNRFQDDVKMPSFIYQIKDKFTDNRVIKRIRNHRPHIFLRHEMTLRGKSKTELERQARR